MNSLIKFNGYTILEEELPIEYLTAAQTVVSVMKEGDERVQDVRDLSIVLTLRDPVAASEWLAGLPESPSRDAGVEVLVKELAKSGPDSARKWAESIVDKNRREKSLKYVEDHSRGNE